MSNVPANPKKIQAESTDFASGVSEFLLDAIAGSVNALIANAKGQLGDIRKSQLDEASFQAANSTDWILADGRDITGSDLALVKNITTVPDLRSHFLKCNDSSLLATQSSSNKSHQHFIFRIPNTGGGGSVTTLRSIKGNPPALAGASFVGGVASEPNAGRSSANGGSEARPLNVALNFFIKINR